MGVPKVVYIGGHGRSGTTITDRVLSEVLGAFSAGEVHRFWEYGLGRDWTCSCGAPLRKCTFWSEVLRQSFSEFGCSEEDILKAWKTVARPKSIFALQYPTLRSTRFQRRLSRYRSFLRTFYESVSQKSKKEVIVDSSGSPLHGYVLSGIRNVDMAMLHVVRDARAVAYSNRKDKINPSRRGSGARMQKKSTVRVALTWLYYNKMFESLKDKFNFGITKKYEELYSSPKSEFKNTAGKLGFQGRIMDVFKGDDKIFLNKGHNGQGNPIRYKSGNIKLEKDVKWERELSRTRKIVASLISYKGLKKYRYE